MTETIWNLGGRDVTGFGLGCSASLLLTLMIIGLISRRKGLPYRVFIRSACLAVPLVLLCSRLVYVLANCTYYLTTLSNPLPALYFWDGGYSLMGAIAGLLAALALGGGSRRLLLLDLAGLAMPFGILAERLCEAGTGMGLGRPVYTPFLQNAFCMTADGLHAVWRYEAAAALLIGVLLPLLCRKTRRGDALLTFMVLFGTSQILLESLRDDGHMVVHFVRIQQLLALLLVVIAISIWSHRARRLPGGKKAALLHTLAACALIGIGIRMEFVIDSSENLLRDYGIMCLSMLGLMAVALHLRHWTEGGAPRGA